jgi:methyl-accepting chemotaxis protein
MRESEAPHCSLLIRQRILGDRIMTCVAWSLFVLALALAPIYGTWREAIFCGLALAIVHQVLMLAMPGSRLTRVASAFIFMCFSALLIDQMHGMIEMHFSVFVLLAFLLFYNDWLPLAVGAATIAVHHLVFHFLQAAGYGVWVFPHLCSIGIVFVHAAFVVAETALLVLMSVQQERTEIETGEVLWMLDTVLAEDRVDLRVRSRVASGSAAKFERLIEMLRVLVAQIVRHSETIVGSSERITVSTSQVSSGSTLQQQQIGLAAVAVEEMRSAGAEIGRGTQNVAANMARSKEQAIEGGRIVSDAIAAIREVAASTGNTAATIDSLGRSSASIGRIVETINDIAGQTNLLALNASIEAARAGQMGRGFAVVAGEVRTLAERTAQATKEIGEMIASIQRETRHAMESMENGSGKVESSVKTAERAGQALRQIIHEVESQGALVDRIVAASAEQTSTMDQVKSYMDEVLRMAEQSVSSASHSANECSAVSGLAVELQNLLRRFDMEEAAPQSSSGGSSFHSSRNSDAPPSRNRSAMTHAPA